MTFEQLLNILLKCRLKIGKKKKKSRPTSCAVISFRTKCAM